MINGKLKKTVEALTQADIENKTNKSGTVSGEQLAALGGGGDYEVLQDWVTVIVNSSTDVNILDGIDVGGTIERLAIEYKIIQTGSNGVQLNIMLTGGIAQAVAGNLLHIEGTSKLAGQYQQVGCLHDPANKNSTATGSMECFQLPGGSSKTMVGLIAETKGLSNASNNSLLIDSKITRLQHWRILTSLTTDPEINLSCNANCQFTYRVVRK